MEDGRRKLGIFKPNPIVAIAFYIIIMFILGTAFLYLFAVVIANSNDNITFNNLIKYMANPNDDTIGTIDVALYSDASSKVQGYGNFMSYFLAFIFVCFYCRNILKESLITLNKYKIQYILLFVVAILFVGATYGIDLLVSKAVPETNNQSTIVSVMKGSGMIPMIISTVLFAPVVEELIYRGCVFYYAKRWSVISGYIISIIFFTIPHMITTPMTNFGIWALQAVPYIASAFLLCLIHHQFKFNIYASMFAHILNNAFAVILIFIV